MDQDSMSPLLGAAGVTSAQGPQAADAVSVPQRIEDMSTDKLQEGLASLSALGLQGLEVWNMFRTVLEKRRKA